VPNSSHDGPLRVGSVFRTHFVNDRSDEQMAWNHLDLTALGRQEE
jgi:predicted dithiol-disulfide oxidoreductase (DUF899 family)